MPKSGSDLGVDLYELWVAGERSLPEVAQQFAEAGKCFGQTESGDGYFSRPAEIGGGGYGPAQRAFAELRMTMSAVFRDSQSNLELAGQALKMAADNYDASDQAAMDQFNAMKDDAGQGRF
ncbi:hypothetical protein [Plantactinospora sp. KLBMP9567]|uniref:hypothetical protein n=1 Tax=Plantactinospora sp. KLBMP9567 TaxID=3085900 RepID=UPI002981CC14|nr:hypothetical protein [Plantactinospora sp. KLBMP9567]MDW5326428.1 hypothetical protein [Plantactinospora sp. KLBMP9567]